MREFERAPYRVRHRESDRDEENDANGERWAGPEQRREIDRCAEQEHGDLKQLLRREIHTRFDARGRRIGECGGAYEDAEEDRDDQRIQ